MFAIGNDELENNSDIGTHAKCGSCGDMHEIDYGSIVNKDGSKTKSKMLAFIKCTQNDKCYLVGINGKSI